MLNVYIAGPMRGKPLYNFPAFDDAAATLKGMGFDVISPADMDRKRGFDPRDLPDDHDYSEVPEGFNLRQCQLECIGAVMSVDEVCLLPGWEDSKGAKSEAALAHWRGIKVWELHPEPILDIAKRITSGDRQAAYGPPNQDFARTASMWNEIFGGKLRKDSRFIPADVAAAMMCLKLSRLTHSVKRDSVVDLAGYAHCMDLCHQAEGVY